MNQELRTIAETVDTLLLLVQVSSFNRVEYHS